MNVFEEIRERITCVDYARDYLPIRRDGDRCPSFIEGGTNKTSVVIHDQSWYDFKAGMGGDVIDLCAALNHNGDKAAALAELKERTGIDTDTESYRSWRSKTQEMCHATQKAHEALRDVDRDYLYRRGLTDKTIEELRIGYSAKENRIMIPFYKNGAVVYWTGRRCDESQNPKYRKPPKDDVKENVPWGLQTLNRKGPLVICEGAFDAISFYQEGYPVLATMGSGFSKAQISEVLDATRDKDEVLIAFDSDKAGRGFFRKLANTFIDNHIANFRKVVLPKGCKDVSDYYANSKDLKELVDGAVNGLTALAEGMNWEEVKKLAYKVGRFMDKEDMAWILDLPFNERQLKDLHKAASSCPPEDRIAREVADAHMLIYAEELGFYEFKKTHWVRTPDTQVLHYIDQALGKHAAGSKCKTTLTLVKGRCVERFEFNKRKAFNFHNGTLDLETGELKKHSPNDLFSYCVDYDYSPEAGSPKWEAFIHDVSAGDEERAEQLQLIAGYVLFADNSLQKIPYLLGSGSNGKSVYLDVLKRVFGPENTSNVEVSGLAEQFQRVQLATSMLNICSEAKSDIKGTEDYLKKISAGDEINGCYKNKDYINFIPRSKMIIAGNEMIKPRDMSYGIVRRMLWVRFPVRFSYDPDPAKGERERKDGLKDELLEELPGIFNWVFDGYKALKSLEHFIDDSKDNLELSGEFERSINPVQDFLENVDLLDVEQNGGIVKDGKIIYADAYQVYRSWAVEAGRAMMTQYTFSREFGPRFCDLHPGWEYGKPIKTETGQVKRGVVDGGKFVRLPGPSTGAEKQVGIVLEGTKLKPEWDLEEAW